MRKKIASAIGAIVLSFSMLVIAPATPAFADACSFSVKNPEKGGDYIWGYTKWTCYLPPDEGAKIYLQILRDGSVWKSSEFWKYGTFSLTFGTGKYCKGTGTHKYRVRSWGYDGQLVTYIGKYSSTLTFWC